jgi:hypothetical protein
MLFQLCKMSLISGRTLDILPKHTDGATTLMTNPKNRLTRTVQDGKRNVNIKQVREQVSAGEYSLRPHAIQHAAKEGFNFSDILHAVLTGEVIERYPDRNRCLFYADIVVEKITLPLHVVCEFNPELDTIVDIVTAYVPTEETWISPRQRRRK